MQKIFLVTIVAASSMFNHSQVMANEHAIGVYAGNITLGSTTESISGITYEYQLSDSWGVAANYDQYTYKDKDDRTNTFIGAHYYPVGRLQFGFGLSSESSEDGSEAGARVSVGYAFNLSRLVITPSYRKYPNASELGVSLQLKF
ncbi:hypothetical protein ACUR5C_02720 [Aliikangiella sp. IMCC44653]